MNISAPYNDWFEFGFTAKLLVTGTNLNQIQVQQSVLTKTLMKQPDGTPFSDADISAETQTPPELQALLNGGTFLQDPEGTQGFGPLKTDAGSNDTTATSYDAQSADFQDHKLPKPNDSTHFTYLATITRTFRLTFLNTRTGKKATFDWGYTWTNSSCATTNADDPNIPQGDSFATNEKHKKGQFTSSEVSGLTSLN